MCTVSCLFEEAPKSKHSKDKSFVHKSSISDRAYENYPRINVQNIRTFCSKVSYLSSMMYMCTLKGMYSAMISMSATAILVNSRLMGLARMSCTQTDVNTKFRNNISILDSYWSFTLYFSLIYPFIREHLINLFFFL